MNTVHVSFQVRRSLERRTANWTRRGLLLDLYALVGGSAVERERFIGGVAAPTPLDLAMHSFPTLLDMLV